MRLDQHWGKPVFRCPSYILVAFDGRRGFSWQVTYSLHGIATDAVLLVHVFNVFCEYQKHVLIGYHMVCPYFFIVSIFFHILFISYQFLKHVETMRKPFRKPQLDLSSSKRFTKFIPHGSFHHGYSPHFINQFTIWLLNMAMENGPGIRWYKLWFTYSKIE